MESHPHIALPLEAFFARLEATGFRMDTARKMRLLRVLEEEGPELYGDFEGLKFRLAPFIARNPLEQERFYDFFDLFIAECAAEAEQVNAFPETQPAPLPPVQPARQFKKWWLIPLLLLSVLAGLYLVFRSQAPFDAPCRVQMEAESGVLLREGDTLIGRNTSTCLDTNAFVWEIRDLASKQIEFTDTAFHLNWRAAGAGQNKLVILRHTEPSAHQANTRDSFELKVHCSNPPLISNRKMPEAVLTPSKPYDFSVSVADGVQVEWIFNNTDTLRGSSVRYAFSRDGETTVGLFAYRPGQKDYCYFYDEKTLNIGGKPYLQTFAVKRDYPRQLLQLNGWYWLFAILPLFFASWLLVRWWKKRHEKTPEKTVADLEAEYPIHDAGPYFVPYLPQGAKITVPRDFFRMAEVMRRRETGIRRYFDAAASVRATVDAGGYPEWREKSDTRPAEYLFLVQRSDERNQQGQLFERLTSFLKRREAPAEVFFHSGSFDVFKNPVHLQGLNLTELKQHYSTHRLVLLGDGHGLINPYNPQTPSLLAAPVKILSSWPRRILLTPEPVSGWSFQEALLHRHFLVCPADTDGMLAGLEMLDRMEEYEPGNFARREAELLRLHPQISHRYRHWETPEDHKTYLKDHPEWYRWLCALAVCVQPDWALTIAVGRAIGVEVTHDGLLALSRIPWLNSNAPDTNLRLALLRQLDPADEALARKAVAEELERVQGRVAGSFAETDWTTGLAMQRFALDPRDEVHKATLRDLKRLGLLSGSQLAELDLIVQEKMDKKGLPARATGGIEAWLTQPAPKPFWTRELLGGMAAMFLSAFLLAYGFYYNLTRAAQPFETGIKMPAGFWVTLIPQDDQAIELNNQAVDVWQGFDRLKLGNDTSLFVLESFNRLIDSNAVDTMMVFHSKGLHNIALLKMAADTFLGRAISLRPSLFYSLADSNRTSLLFNFTTEQFRFFLDSLQQQAVAIKKGEQNVLMKKTTKNAIVSQNPPVKRVNELEEIRNAYAKLAKPSTWYSYGFTAYNERSPLCLAALHGQGLCDFYLERRDSAMAAYNQLLILSDSLYFDTLSMPVNLRTLLDFNPPVVEIKPETKIKPKQNNVVVKKSKLPTTKRLLDTQAPSKELIMKALEGFRFGASSGVTEEESRSVLTWLGASDIRQNQSKSSGPYLEGRLKSGLVIGIWTNVSRKGDIYGFRYGKEPDLMAETADATYFELTRYSNTRIPVPIPAMVRVSGGTFIMGCQDKKRDGQCEYNEKPAHEVTLSDYYIGKYEVTNEEFAVFLNEYGLDYLKSDRKKKLIYEHEWGIAFHGQGDAATSSFAPQKGYEKYPVVYVTWYGASEYARWLSQKTGQAYRLPSEAEWEYAARGGQSGEKSNFMYSGSNNVDEVSWYSSIFTRNPKNQSHPVGRKKANQIGLFDMSGNVWEWCQDSWHEDYERAPGDGSAWQDNDNDWERVIRGGSWSFDNNACRVSSRYYENANSRVNSFGFRLAGQISDSQPKK